MKIVSHIDELPVLTNPAVTIGNFDGVHLGHQRIFREVMRRRGPKVVISFDRPTGFWLGKPDYRGEILPLETKWRIFERFGFEYAVRLSFQEIHSLLALEFVLQLVHRMKDPLVIVGEDFHFGRDRTGNIHLLREWQNRYGYRLKVVSFVKKAKDVVSSTAIRHAVAAGDMELAAKLLGRAYVYQGKVFEGDKIGQKIGFPTINIAVGTQVIPKEGVYASWTLTEDGWHPSMSYVGYRPTVHGKDLRMESHVLSGIPVVGKTVACAFVKKIRDEKTFHNLEELKKMLYNDRVKVLWTLRFYSIKKTLKGLEDRSLWL
ncbi:bifunctional riboflavin kinase/FAD synthetase [Thermospira aquatica]|uniref:Riboflavin biosynthesis protein n=1 Tax=Thermospira aquatica TaxID=2828656 RepID=A0AAX3BD60_9SPIR|nr:bifunctional riboflavin kinase/FAD synthetase [Thermospira aquatica]URA10191.1 bifunctional riboflavin kinase/FAD synthetase [Thermospira aquatica]